MAGVKPPQRRLLPDGHGRHACAIFNLVVPLAHEATAMRIQDSTGGVRARSRAVSQLIGHGSSMTFGEATWIARRDAVRVGL